MIGKILAFSEIPNQPLIVFNEYEITVYHD